MEEKNNDPWWWFSFSFKGTNNGCCNVQALTKEEALQKTIDLDIHPSHDHISCCRINKAELKADKLFSKKEMYELNYQSYVKNPANK